MDAVLHVLRHAVPDLRMQPVAMGEAAYRSGHMNGILPQTWDALAQHPVLLKGPMTTPQGGGYKSINVTLRKTLGLFANVRPCVAYHPYVDALHPVQCEIAVDDAQSDDVVSAIRESAQTGRIGDGKIFVLDLEHVMRIRTGETGAAAL